MTQRENMESSHDQQVRGMQAQVRKAWRGSHAVSFGPLVVCRGGRRKQAPNANVNVAAKSCPAILPSVRVRSFYVLLLVVFCFLFSNLPGAGANLLEQFMYREPTGIQRLDVPGYRNRVLFSFRMESPIAPGASASSTERIDTITLLSPPGYQFNQTCTRDFAYQHHLIFDATTPPNPTTDFAELLASTNNSCVGSTDSDGRGRAVITLQSTNLLTTKIYPFAIKVVNPLVDPLLADVSTSTMTAGPAEWSLFLSHSTVHTSNPTSTSADTMMAHANGTLTAFPLRRFKDPKVRLSQRNKSPTCLNPYVGCPVGSINSYQTGVDCVQSGCVEEAQISIEFGAFAAIGVGGRLEVVLPKYHSVSPYTTCNAWKRAKMAGASSASSSGSSAVPVVNTNTWIPWLEKDLLCTVLPDLKSITMDFIDKTQLYLEGGDKFDYRFEFTVLLPDGNLHLEPDVAAYYWWVFGYAPSAGIVPYADSIPFGIQVLRPTLPGVSSSRDAVVDAVAAASATTAAPALDEFSGGTTLPSATTNLFSMEYLPSNPYPDQSVRIASLSLHEASDFFQVQAQSVNGPGRSMLGGEVIEIYFFVRFRFEVFPGTRVHFLGPLGYDFSNFCNTLVVVSMIANQWTVTGTLSGFKCETSQTEMVLTRTGYVEWLGQTPMNLKVQATNPMVVEAWNKLDNFWEVLLIGSSTTTTTTAAPVDCSGSWSNYTNCTDALQTRTYSVDTPAGTGGFDCAYADNQVDTSPCEEFALANCTGRFGPFKTCANGQMEAMFGVIQGYECPYISGFQIAHSCGQNCVGGWTGYSVCAAKPDALCLFGYLLDLKTASVPHNYTQLDGWLYHELLHNGKSYPEALLGLSARTLENMPEANMTGKIGWKLNSCPTDVTAAKTLVDAGQEGALSGVTLQAERYRYFAVKTPPADGGKPCPFSTNQIQTIACTVSYSSPPQTTTTTTPFPCDCSLASCLHNTTVCGADFNTYSNRCAGLAYGQTLQYGSACGVGDNMILEAKSFLSYNIIPQFQNPVVRLTGVKRGAGVKTKLEFEFFALSPANTLYLFSEPQLDLAAISFAEVETYDPVTNERKYEVRQPFGYDADLAYPYNPLVVGIMAVNAITIPGNYSRTFFRLIDLVFPVGTQSVRYTIRSFTDRNLRDEMFFEGFTLPGGIHVYDVWLREQWWQKTPASLKSQYMLPRVNVRFGRAKVEFSVANPSTRFLEIRSANGVQFAPVDVCLYEKASGKLVPLRSVFVYQAANADGSGTMDDILHLELGERGDASTRDNALFGHPGPLVFEAAVTHTTTIAPLEGSATTEIASVTSTSTIVPQKPKTLTLRESLLLENNRESFPILRGTPTYAFQTLRIPRSDAMPDGIPLATPPEPKPAATTPPPLNSLRELELNSALSYRNGAGGELERNQDHLNPHKMNGNGNGETSQQPRQLTHHAPNLNRIVGKMQFDVMFQEYTEVYTNWKRPSSLVPVTAAPKALPPGFVTSTTTTTTTITTTYQLASDAPRISFTYTPFSNVMADAMARSLFCDNGDYHLFGSYDKYWSNVDMAPNCKNKARYVWQQPRIRVLDVRPGLYDEFGRAFPVQYDFFENTVVGGGFTPGALSDGIPNPYTPGLDGPEECKLLCSAHSNCTIIQYSKSEKNCQWRFTDAPWAPTPQIGKDTNSYAQRGLTVFFEIAKNVSTAETPAPELYARLRERLENPRSDFLHDPEFYPLAQRVTSLVSIKDDGSVVPSDVATTSTTTTTVTEAITTSTTTTTTCIFTDPNDTNSTLYCGEDMGEGTAAVSSNETTFEEHPNFTQPWWGRNVSNYLPYRQGLVCPSRVETWGLGNYTFYSDLTSYGRSLSVPTPHGILDHKHVNMSYLSSTATSNVETSYVLESNARYVADFFMRSPQTGTPTEPFSATNWALDTWIDPSFSPTDPQNMQTGRLPLNTNDFLDVGPGGFGDLDAGELSKATTNHAPPSALLVVQLAVRPSKKGKKYILYAAENFTFVENAAVLHMGLRDTAEAPGVPIAVKEELPTRNLGKARMSWVYIHENERVKAADPTTYFNNFEVDTRLQQRDMRFPERDSIEFACPWVWLNPEPGIYTKSFDCIHTDPLQLELGLYSPRNLTSISTFFFESYGENDEFLGYGEIEGFPLSSLEAQITFPKMAQVYQTVVGISVKTRVMTPAQTKLRIKAPTGIHLSCYNLDTFWRVVTTCQTADPWRNFFVIFNETIPVGDTINLASTIMGLTPATFFPLDRTFDLYLEADLSAEAAMYTSGGVGIGRGVRTNVDVKHDFYETDGLQVVESLFVERPFPPGMHVYGNDVILYLHFTQTLGLAIKNITIDFPSFMFPPVDGTVVELETEGEDGETLTTTTTTGMGMLGANASNGTVLGAADDAAAGLSGSNASAAVTTTPPATTTTAATTIDPSSGGTTGAPGTATALEPGAQATTTTTTTSTTFNLYNYDAANPIVFYEHHEMPVQYFTTMNTNEQKRVTLVLNSVVEQGHYGIRMTMGSDYYLVAPTRTTSDRAIYLRMHFNNSEFTTFFYGGAEKLMDFELDKEYYNLKDPRPATGNARGGKWKVGGEEWALLAGLFVLVWGAGAGGDGEREDDGSGGRGNRRRRNGREDRRSQVGWSTHPAAVGERLGDEVAAGEHVPMELAQVSGRGGAAGALTTNTTGEGRRRRATWFCRILDGRTAACRRGCRMLDRRKVEARLQWNKKRPRRTKAYCIRGWLFLKHQKFFKMNARQPPPSPCTTTTQKSSYRRYHFLHAHFHYSRPGAQHLLSHIEADKARHLLLGSSFSVAAAVGWRDKKPEHTPGEAGVARGDESLRSRQARRKRIAPIDAFSLTPPRTFFRCSSSRHIDAG